MPIGAQFDVVLGGKGFMLARGQFAGRAWKRSGLPNAVRPTVAAADAQRNAQPAEVDFVATYDDFSGGFGDAYRDPVRTNRIHWSENFESRFPRQLVHCQLPQTLAGNYNSSPSGANSMAGDYGAWWVLQVPDTDVGSGKRPTVGGRGSLLMEIGGGNNSTDSSLIAIKPTGIAGSGRAFDRTSEYDTINSPIHRFMGRAAIFGSFAWIPTESRLFWRRDLTGLAGIAATQGPLPGQQFAVAGNRMWKAGNDPLGLQHVNLLQSVGLGSDPMGTANWSATLSIGNGQVDVLDMIPLNDQLFVSTQDGLYAGDTSGTFVNVLGEVASQFHPDNGRNLAIHDGTIIYPYIGGLKAYINGLDTAISRDIGPRNTSQRSPIRGRFRATHSYAGWLYGGYYTGSQSYILAGRDNGQDFDWFPLQRLPHPSMVRQLYVDGITTPSGGGNVGSGNALLPNRMWALTELSCNTGSDTSATSHIYWWPIPSGDSNPLAAPMFSANYIGSARVDFGRDNRGAPETLKVLRRVDVNTDASTFLSGSRYADVYYILDGGTRSLLGRAQQSPRTTLFFPSGEGSFVTCYDFELSVESFAASGGLTPVYRSFVTHGAFLTEGTDEIVAVFDISSRRADRTGTPMRSSLAQLTDLRNMAGGLPVALIDLTGATNWVTVSRGLQEQETYQAGNDDPEVAVTVQMSVQAFS